MPVTRKRTTKQPSAPEKELQKAVATYLNNLSALGKRFTWCHVPNEGKRSVQANVSLIAQGLKPGCADCVIMPTDGRSFFIELKALGNTLSDKQKAYKAHVEALGFQYYMVRDRMPHGAVSQVQTILEEQGLV